MFLGIRSLRSGIQSPFEGIVSARSEEGIGIARILNNPNLDGRIAVRLRYKFLTKTHTHETFIESLHEVHTGIRYTVPARSGNCYHIILNRTGIHCPQNHRIMTNYSSFPKTRIDFFHTLPKAIADRVFANADVYNLSSRVTCMTDALEGAFEWAKSFEGHEYWESIWKKYHRLEKELSTYTELQLI